MRPWARIRTDVRTIGEITRRIIGAPDYERYLAHMRQRHPGTEPMSREEFHRRRLEEKYSRPGPRCC